MEYSEVKEQIKQKLPVQKEFGDSENLLELGLSSIVIMRLVNQWRKQGVKVAFGTLMEHPTLKEWWKIIQKGTKKKGKKAKAEKRDIIMERDMRKPFPLTDVQYAYWVGREDNQVLGGIGCHAYLEFDGYGVVPERLQEAWSRIQYHHPMLRASFSENGMQKIESKPYSEKIKINDFSLLTETEAEQEAQLLHNLRKEDWNQRFDVLPERQKNFVRKECTIPAASEQKVLFQEFFENVERSPERIAIIDTGKELEISYSRLKEMAQRVAAGIIKRNIKEESIAITIPKAAAGDRVVSDGDCKQNRI